MLFNYLLSLLSLVIAMLIVPPSSMRTSAFSPTPASISLLKHGDTNLAFRSCSPSAPVLRMTSNNGGKGNNNLGKERLSSSPTSPKKEEKDEEGYQVEVSYEGLKASLHVKPDEPILTAMERSNISNKLCLPNLPHECRRGNCMTCTGVHAPNSKVDNLVSNENGLAPHLSKTIFSEESGGGGYVLTCSSYVVGDGVKLELGRNDDIWTEVYSNRLMGCDMERIGMEARARSLRRVAEHNVPKWKKETEEALRQSDR